MDQHHLGIEPKMKTDLGEEQYADEKDLWGDS
jgi:hypothetical protein